MCMAEREGEEQSSQSGFLAAGPRYRRWTLLLSIAQCWGAVAAGVTMLGCSARVEDEASVVEGAASSSEGAVILGDEAFEGAEG